MTAAKELIRIRPGSPAAFKLRAAAISGEAKALKRYVYWTAWQSIQKDKYTPMAQRVKAFHELVSADAIEVNLLGPKT